MNQVTSKDGTTLAYERLGHGPAVVLVSGGLDDGAENAPLARELAGSFTVYNYARRGRGDSGDTLPYSMEREIEDLEALIGAAGGPACLYGVSSGGALVLEAAAAGLAVDKLAVYEVPYSVGEDAVQGWRDYVQRLDTALARGDRGEALECFMRFAGSSEDDIAAARSAPVWGGLEALAHTLAYDAACLADGRPPARLSRITQPTLVITGGVAPDSQAGMEGLATDFFVLAAEAVASRVPHAGRLLADGSGHMADPKAIARMLERFFTS
jgi:pimeloyl-ACP methyl ester carboxylesterase